MHSNALSGKKLNIQNFGYSLIAIKSRRPFLM